MIPSIQLCAHTCALCCFLVSVAGLLVLNLVVKAHHVLRHHEASLGNLQCSRRLRCLRLLGARAATVVGGLCCVCECARTCSSEMVT